MNIVKEGIVYTPDRIADYIAKTSIKNFFFEKLKKKFLLKILNLNNFFEKLIQKETNGQFFVNSTATNYDKEQAKYIFKEIKNLTILDPAVGNGQFLYAALKVLENAFLNLKALGIIDWSLYDIRKYIITHNLFGVDIDYEAINSAKKRFSSALNNVKADVKNKKSLLTINSNLKVGNALIGFINQSEIIDQQQLSQNDIFYHKIKSISQTHEDLKTFKAGETKKGVMDVKFKPFHWFLEFPEVMKKGGFDIIIENPPYISNKQLSPLEKDIFRKIYETPKGLMNTFGIFIERSIKLCHPLSRLGFIVHKNIIRSNNYYLLRKYLLKNTTIEEIIDVGAGIFDSITAETIIIILKTTIPPKNHEIVIKTEFPSQNNLESQDPKIKSIYQNIFLEQENYNINLNLQYKELEVINYIKMKKDHDLIDLFEAKTCIATGNDEKFLKNYKVNNSYKKTLRGKNIGKYYINFDNLYLKYNPKELHRARDEALFRKSEKLIMKTISSDLTVAYDNKNFYPLSTCIVIVPKNDSDNKDKINYILLLMNSKLMNFYYDFVFNLGAHLTTEISVNNINHLPIKLPKNYKLFSILAKVMIRINKIESIREENKEYIDTLTNIIDILIYIIMFEYKFQSDGLNNDIINLVYKYLIKIEDFSIKQIQKCIKSIENDVNIKEKVSQIKNHSWVKIIDNYFKS
jgi:hypothetical protein